LGFEEASERLEVDLVAAEVFVAVAFVVPTADVVPTVDVVIFAVSVAESFVFAVLTAAAASEPTAD
jgi:hypothetical protein